MVLRRTPLPVGGESGLLHESGQLGVLNVPAGPGLEADHDFGRVMP